MFPEALFIIARRWKEPRCHSTKEWIQKMRYIYTMEYYSAIKNNTKQTSYVSVLCIYHIQTNKEK